MSTSYFLTALAFIGVGVLLLSLLMRLFRLRWQRDESTGSQEHWVGWDVDGGEGGGNGGD